ncbi:MAG TPA: hypothetical protein VF079_02935 [Sphingomicrobium sp.]
MQRWLVIAALGPLLAATVANAQSNRMFDVREPPPQRHSRGIDLRLIEEPSIYRLTPPSTGFSAETEVAPNARLGFRMMSVARPRLGPEWRVDGRAQRARKPAVSFTLRF